jgi:hypothetical protein
MPEDPSTLPPTKEGQNTIIKNLSNIFMTLIGLALTALFAWGRSISEHANNSDVTIQGLKDEIIRLEAKLDGTNKGLKADIQEVASDVDELKDDAEKVHDDLKIRTTKVEDWQMYWQLYHPIISPTTIKNSK